MFGLSNIAKALSRPRYQFQGSPSEYSQGDVFLPGAEGFALRQMFGSPSTSVRGAGTRVMRQLNPFQPPPFYQELALPTNPQQGFVTGSFDISSLYDPTGGSQ